MKPLILLILLIAALSGGYYWMSTHPATVAPEPAGLFGSGTIEAETVAITAELGGRILKIEVEEGDEVAAGQLLVELDKATLLAQQTQLEAALTTAKVNLELASAPPRPEEVAAAQAQLNQARVTQSGAGFVWNQAQQRVDDPQELEAALNQGQARVTEAGRELELAQVQLKRAEIQAEAASRDQSDHAALVQNEVAQQRLQAARTGVQMAEVALAGAQQQVAHLEQMRAQPLALIAQANTSRAIYHQTEAVVLAAEANLAAVQAGPTAEDIAIAQAQVAEAEAALALVEAQLAKQTLTAPRDGLISRKLVEPGELASPGMVLLELSDLKTVDLVVYIPETQIGRVKIGQKARVYVDAYEAELFEGRISFIAHEAEFTPRNVQTQEERANLVFAVKISLANGDHRLKPGMPADAEILPEASLPSSPTATPPATTTPTASNSPTPSPSPTPAATPSTATPPPAPTPMAPQAEIIAWALNVRGGPGPTYPVIAYLSKGDSVTVIDRDPASGWLQIRFGDGSGWIANNPAYVRLE